MPTPQITPPQMGQHTTLIVLAGLAVSATGVLSIGTPPSTLIAATVPTNGFGLSGSGVSLWAQRRGNGMTTNVNRAEVSSASSLRDNEVITSQSRSLSLEIFLGNFGTDPNPLEAYCEAYDYFMATWITGTRTGSIETHAFIGIRGNQELASQGKGEVTATLDLGPVDIGGPQYVRSVA